MKNLFVRKIFAASMFLLWSSVAPASAQQTNVKLNFSGSMVATSIAVKADSVTDQEILAGGGTLGSFTLHKLRTDAAAPQSSSTCLGPNKLNLPVLTGGAVFRFQDGSLLMAKVTSGGLCIDLSVGVGQLSEGWQITGGTGRFKKASGSLTLTSTVLPVLFTDANNAVLLANFGELRGTLTGIGEDD